VREAEAAMAKTLISVVVPVYREEHGVRPMHAAIQRVFAGLPQYEFELIFVNDGSPDGSAAVIAELCREDPRCRLIDLARNFGKEIALSAGMPYVTGAAAICLDADLQHPPRYIPQMLEAWENGAEIVEMVRTAQDGESWVRKRFSDLFYWILNKISDVKISPKTTDFRLLDRKVVASIATITERQRMFRGLVDWVGYRKVAFPFEADARTTGKAVYSYAKLTNLALNSFISHSSLPLKFVGVIGVLISVASVLTLAFMVGDRYAFGNHLNFSSVAILAVFNTVLIGLVLTALGLMSLYISKIYSETQNRPLVVVRRALNVAPPAAAEAPSLAPTMSFGLGLEPKSVPT
jgi:dolichol-phosphate mannosyltransferase